MGFKKVDVKTLEMKPFEKIGSEWMLISAAKDGKANTMTASWGGIGVLLIFYKLDKIYPRIITEMKQREAAEAAKTTANV